MIELGSGSKTRILSAELGTVSGRMPTLSVAKAAPAENAADTANNVLLNIFLSGCFVDVFLVYRLEAPDRLINSKKKQDAQNRVGEAFTYPSHTTGHAGLAPSGSN